MQIAFNKSFLHVCLYDAPLIFNSPKVKHQKPCHLRFKKNYNIVSNICRAENVIEFSLRTKYLNVFCFFQKIF